MSGDPELTCKEMITIAEELAAKIKQTEKIPEDFYYTTFWQDLAQIRHEFTNYDEILREFTIYQIPALMLYKNPEVPPEGINCICDVQHEGEDCRNLQYAYYIIKEAANELVRQIYRGKT